MAFKIEWSEEARADIRTLDKPTAIKVLTGFSISGETIRVQAVEHRSDAYR